MEVEQLESEVYVIWTNSLCAKKGQQNSFNHTSLVMNYYGTLFLLRSLEGYVAIRESPNAPVRLCFYIGANLGTKLTGTIYPHLLLYRVQTRPSQF